jgi:uncharacterized membrane protein YdbT with pleckstrin-like domain
MGAYVDGNLLPGEQVVARANLHWAMFIGPVLLFVFALLIGRSGGGFLLAVLAVIWGVYRGLVYLTTELAITNKRVIAKTGIIRRNVIDVSNGKVEGITYNQGIVGRIFGYGSILVRGTGIGQVPIPFISRPDYFKREVGSVLHA